MIADPGIVAAGLVEPAAESLRAAGLAYAVYDRVMPNPDSESVDAAAAAYRESEADLIVGIGGGSGLDTAFTLHVSDTRRDGLFATRP